MPTLKIPEMTANTAPLPADLMEIAQAADGDSRKSTIKQLVGAIRRTLFNSGTTVNSATASETDLHAYSIAANTLLADHDSIEATFTVSFAANGNNKRLRVYWGTTTIYDSTALAINNGVAKVTVEIYRTGASAERCTVTVQSSNATLPSTAVYTTATENTASPLTLKITGTAPTANNDVVGLVSKVRYNSAA